MLNDVTRRNFLSSVAVGAAAVTAGQATYFAGPKLRWLLDDIDGFQGQGKYPGQAVQDRPHYLPHRLCQPLG